jgi:hypothetical protein
VSKVLKPDTVEEYERLLQAASEQQVVVQPYGDYQLIVPTEWKPPKAPKTEVPSSTKSEPDEPNTTGTSARSSKEVG